MVEAPRALSYAQLKAALWNRSGARVHAVIDGLAVPGLAAKLATGDVVGWDCLKRGALSPQDAEQAPYIAELRPEGEFTDWLLATATAVHPQWGALVISAHPLLAVRGLCRDLGVVHDHLEERRDFRWFDPEVLEVLLPSLAPSQLDDIFRIDQSIVLLSRDTWRWYSMVEGVLSTDQRQLMPGTAPS